MDGIASWLGQLQWDKALELLITASPSMRPATVWRLWLWAIRLQSGWGGSP